MSFTVPAAARKGVTRCNARSQNIVRSELDRVSNIACHTPFSRLNVHPRAFSRVVDLKSWHVGKDYGEATNISVGHVADGKALDLDFVKKIFEYTERGRGNLAFAVVSSQVLGRVQMERLRRAFENGTADISQTLIRGFNSAKRRWVH